MTSYHRNRTDSYISSQYLPLRSTAYSPVSMKLPRQLNEGKQPHYEAHLPTDQIRTQPDDNLMLWEHGPPSLQLPNRHDPFKVEISLMREGTELGKSSLFIMESSQPLFLPLHRLFEGEGLAVVAALVLVE